MDDCSSSNCLCGQLSIRCWYDKVRVPHLVPHLAKSGRSHRRTWTQDPALLGKRHRVWQEVLGPARNEAASAPGMQMDSEAGLPSHFLVSDLSLQTLCALPPLPWAGVRVEFPVESSGSRAAETGPTEKPLSPSLRTPGRAAASGV